MVRVSGVLPGVAGRRVLVRREPWALAPLAAKLVVREIRVVSVKVKSKIYVKSFVFGFWNTSDLDLIKHWDYNPSTISSNQAFFTISIKQSYNKEEKSKYLFLSY